MKPEFLMEAQKYLSKHQPIVNQFFYSEKLDGQRAIWDGGITRGIPKRLIPWANHKRDERFKTFPDATGLWSRYGNVIHAPHTYLNTLPVNVPLDGELYLDRNSRQDLRKIIARHTPHKDWDNVKFMVFDSPSYSRLFASRIINTTNFKTRIDSANIVPSGYESIGRHAGLPFGRLIRPYTELYLRLVKQFAGGHPHIQVIQQYAVEDHLFLMHQLNHIDQLGGEGLMLRHGDSSWMPHRSPNLLKLKKLDDAEGTVVGYRTGRSTEAYGSGSRNLGKLGSLELAIGPKDKLITFELSGFTDQEREVCSEISALWAKCHPGEKVPHILKFSKHFPLGTVVSFKYRGKSKDGIPLEARYWRKND